MHVFKVTLDLEQYSFDAYYRFDQKLYEGFELAKAELEAYFGEQSWACKYPQMYCSLSEGRGRIGIELIDVKTWNDV